MSTLSQVRTALEQNPDVVFFENPVKNFLPSADFKYSVFVEIYAAVKHGSYDVEELEGLRTKLIPGVTPSESQKFTITGGDMIFGVLCYDEKIGTEKISRDVNLTDEDALWLEGFLNGKLVTEKTTDVKRRTRIRLYPNVTLARNAAFHGEYVESIPRRELAEHHRFELLGSAAG